VKALQLLLAGMGINIDPTQIEKAFADGKELLPKIAADFQAIRAAQEKLQRDVADMKVKFDAWNNATSDQPKLSEQGLIRDEIGGVDWTKN